MELRVKIDERFMDELKRQLEQQAQLAPSGVRITQDALALYKWAVEEASKGRVILSAEQNGAQPSRVVMPGLNPAKSV